MHRDSALLVRETCHQLNRAFTRRIALKKYDKKEDAQPTLASHKVRGTFGPSNNRFVLEGVGHDNFMERKKCKKCWENREEPGRMGGGGDRRNTLAYFRWKWGSSTSREKERESLDRTTPHLLRYGNYRGEREGLSIDCRLLPRWSHCHSLTTDTRRAMMNICMEDQWRIVVSEAKEVTGKIEIARALSVTYFEL